MLKIPLVNAGIEVHIYPYINTERMMLTTTPLATCDEILDFICPKNADFCETSRIADESDLEIDQPACRNEYVYLYLAPQDYREKSSFEVYITVTDDVQCDAPMNQGTDSMNQQSGDQQSGIEDTDNNFSDSDEAIDNLSDWDFCGVLDEPMCQTDPTNCSSRCIWTSCSVNMTGILTQTEGACVPAGTNKSTIVEICSADEEFTTAAPENQVIYMPTCAVTLDQSTISPHTSILKMIFTVFMISFSLFMILVCFYRYQFRKYQVGPFRSPEWCPRFVFPRHRTEGGFVPIVVETQLEYQPPVPVL